MILIEILNADGTVRSAHVITYDMLPACSNRENYVYIPFDAATGEERD